MRIPLLLVVLSIPALNGADHPEIKQPVEWRAPRIRGGQRFNISKGDIINIPVGPPHQMDFEPGESVTYVMVKVIEPKGE